MACHEAYHRVVARLLPTQQDLASRVGTRRETEGDRARQFLVAEHEHPCPERKTHVEPEKSRQVVAVVELTYVRIC